MIFNGVFSTGRCSGRGSDSAVEDLNRIGALGLTLPTPGYIAGAILFGVIGYAAYRYGKTTTRPYVRWIGLALMLYTLVISDTTLMYAIGGLLCAGLYWFRHHRS